jgi:hypothetical protein
MTKPRLWITVAAGSALAIALTTAALGADVTDTSSDLTGPANVSLPAQASGVATAVLNALIGGSSPSTDVSNGHSQAASHQATNEGANDENEAADNDTEGQESNQAGTTGTKPGWGCGDLNHTHTGPPGHPLAQGETKPCDRH